MVFLSSLLAFSAGAGATDPIEDFHDVLRRSASGQALLRDLKTSCGSAEVGLRLFAARLEAEVTELTGRLLDASDPRLLLAARSLHRVPRRLRDDALVTSLVLVDGWVSTAVDQVLGPRVVDELREHRWSRDATVRRSQLEERFPLRVPRTKAMLGATGLQLWHWRTDTTEPTRWRAAK